MPRDGRQAGRRSSSAGPEMQRTRMCSEPLPAPVSRAAPPKLNLMSRRTFSLYSAEDGQGALQHHSIGTTCGLPRRDPAEAPRRPPPMPGTQGHLTEMSPRRQLLAPRPPSACSSRHSSASGRSGASSEASTGTHPRSILRAPSAERDQQRASSQPPKRVTFAKDCKVAPPSSMVELIALCRTGSDDQLRPVAPRRSTPPLPPAEAHPALRTSTPPFLPAEAHPALRAASDGEAVRITAGTEGRSRGGFVPSPDLAAAKASVEPLAAA